MSPGVELARLRWWPAAAAVVLVGLLVLVLRAAGLAAALAADLVARVAVWVARAAAAAEWADRALAARWGVAPLGASVVVLVDPAGRGGGVR